MQQQPTMAIDSTITMCLCLLLAFCLVTSTLTAVMSILFLLTKEDEAEHQPKPVLTRSIRTQTDNKLEMDQEKQVDAIISISVCGKRKHRDASNAFDDSNTTETQTKKHRRTSIEPITQRFVRSCSVDAISPSKKDMSLRRVVSCEEARSRTAPVSWSYSIRSQERKCEERNDVEQAQSVSSTTKASAAVSFLLDKLRKGVRNAVDEVLTSVFSFLTYAALLFVMRQYSAIAVGVSLDLGSFSIEL